MIKMKLLGTKHVLWHKVFHKDLGLIMTKRIHLDIITLRYLISLFS